MSIREKLRKSFTPAVDYPEWKKRLNRFIAVFLIAALIPAAFLYALVFRLMLSR